MLLAGCEAAEWEEEGRQAGMAWKMPRGRRTAELFRDAPTCSARRGVCAGVVVFGRVADPGDQTDGLLATQLLPWCRESPGPRRWSVHQGCQ